MSICELRSVAASAGLLIVLASGSVAVAQSARVQFIHASPYAEVQAFDVYRNGTLWLDDFAYQDATPFTDWPKGERFRLDFTWADAPDNSNPYFSKTLELRPGERYYVAAAGDPLDKPGQPAFRLVLRAGVLEQSPVSSMVSFQFFNVSPDAPSFTPFARGWIDPDGGARAQEIPYVEFGDMMETAAVIPAWQIEADLRTRDGVILASWIDNLLGFAGRASIIVISGFVDPPRPGDGSLEAAVVIYADGETIWSLANNSRVQFIHNSPYAEADSIDVVVTRLDEIGPDEIVLHVDNLAFREASPYLDLPSGLTVSGEHPTSPELVIDVTSADGTDTLTTKRLRLQSEQTHVMVLAGDPLQRPDHQPMDLFVTDQGHESAADSGAVDLLFFNGSGDVISVAIGFQNGGVPIAPTLPFGSFTPNIPFGPRNDTLYVADAESREVLAFFETSLETQADSALVVLASGFRQPPKGLAAEESDLVLVAATPSGGKLITFMKDEPPPWWKQPFYYLIGLVGVAVAVALGSQLRVRRLEARAQELGTLVDERTRELRLEKEKTEDQARRLSELDEAKNRFFANISHEFRTPLTLILGPVQDLIDGAFGELPTQVGAQHRLMRRSARRLLRLVNQLLDLSRLESGKMELQRRPGDLIGFLRELVRVFTPLAERRRVSLEFTSSIDALPTNFDADAIEKVFANLVSNALKFTPEGGRVTVQADLGEGGEETGSRPARVSVRDTGSGISQEHLERIFERFQQGDTSIRRSHEGSGIGLTLARELAELHGGSLTAESVVGEGSTFTVVLPIDDPVGEPDPDLRRIDTVLLEESLIAPDENGLHSGMLEPGEEDPRILIVEDNADVREYLRSHLGARYRLIEAEDGEAGLEAAREHKPDLILSDVMMPRMDGYEMCRLIKEDEDLRHIPVIMLTAKAGERDTVEGLESGADDYIAKPFSARELQARVTNFISSRRLLREKFSREIIVKPGDIQITPEDELFLESVLEVVDKHLGDANFSVDWLADDVGISRRHLLRRIQSVTGQSPGDLVRNLRLQRASQLLRARAGTISEIAYAVGFGSPKHFSAVFREKYGESPTEHADAKAEPASKPTDI